MDQINERLIAIEEWRATELAKQILAMEEWRAKQVRLTRKVVRWLALALVLFAAAVGVGFWQIDNLIEANSRAIVAQNNFDRRLAMEQYHLNVIRWEACRDRNALFRQQLRQDQEQLQGLVKAHRLDGDVEVTKFWERYAKQGQETKLPECGPKPEPPTNLPANVPKEQP